MSISPAPKGRRILVLTFRKKYHSFLFKVAENRQFSLRLLKALCYTNFVQIKKSFTFCCV
jgi:hypothetical protein